MCSRFAVPREALIHSHKFVVFQQREKRPGTRRGRRSPSPDISPASGVPDEVSGLAVANASPRNNADGRFSPRSRVLTETRKHPFADLRPFAGQSVSAHPREVPGLHHCGCSTEPAMHSRLHLALADAGALQCNDLVRRGAGKGWV